MMKIFVLRLNPKREALQQGVWSNQLLAALSQEQWWHLHCPVAVPSMSNLCCLRTLHPGTVNTAGPICTQLQIFTVHLDRMSSLDWHPGTDSCVSLSLAEPSYKYQLSQNIKQKRQMHLSSKASGAEGGILHMEEYKSPLYTGEFHCNGGTQKLVHPCEMSQNCK